MIDSLGEERQLTERLLGIDRGLDNHFAEELGSHVVRAAESSEDAVRRE